MQRRALFWSGAALLSAMAGTPAAAQEKEIRLEKPAHVFYYPQVNVQWGFDQAEPGDHWGLADRGSRTDLSFEVFAKDATRLLLDYTKLLRAESYNAKLALEFDPEEDDANDIEPRLRLYDTWMKLDTRWDRTSVTVGHKTIPYGHNPRLDPGSSFLTTGANVDLTFGRDTGAFFQTPASGELDWELSLTGGKGDTWDYHGGWLVTSRLGRPTYARDELGLSLVAGEIQRTSGTRTTNRTLTEVVRGAVDWVHKRGEWGSFANQVAFGRNREGDTQERLVVQLVNTIEAFPMSRFSVGMTHALTYEKLQEDPNESRTRGVFLWTFSYELTRDVRIRVNPFAEYNDTGSNPAEGVLFQVCWGCGLTK